MDHCLNVILAQKLGINTALVVQVLYDEIHEEEWAEHKLHTKSTWIKANYPKLSAVMGCMSEDMVATAVRKLLKLGIIKRAVISDDKFDHSGWYSFTNAGDQIMHDALTNVIFISEN
jgi:hypothetical protein